MPGRPRRRNRGGGLHRVGVWLGNREEVHGLARRIASRRPQSPARGQPIRRPDGIRPHAVLPPIARDGPYLSLRILRRHAYSLADLISAGTLDAGPAAMLAAIVAARRAYFVTAAPTPADDPATALSSLVPGTERIVVEDAAELRRCTRTWCRCRPGGPQCRGGGTVTLR